MVRRMALRSGVWDQAAWGLPINQGDLFFQVVGFTRLVISSLERMGYRVTDQEKSAYYAFWRYLAALLGVDKTLLPLINEQDCGRFWDLWFLTNPGPDEHCMALADASLTALSVMMESGFMTRRVQLPILCAVTRWLLGDEICDGLKIRRTAWSRVLPVIYRPAVQASELVGQLTGLDRSKAVARAIHKLMLGSAAVGVMPKGTQVVSESARLEGLASFKPIAPSRSE